MSSIVKSILAKHYDGKMVSNVRSMTSRVYSFKLDGNILYLKLITEADTVMGIDYVLSTSVDMANQGIGAPILGHGRHCEVGYLIMHKLPYILDDIYFSNKQYYDEQTTILVDRMHDLGVVHGDLNAINIGVSADNTIYFFDFDKAWPTTQIKDQRVINYLSKFYDWDSTPEEFIEYERTQFVQD